MFDIFKKLTVNRKNGSIEHLVVGLGNPGSKYENTRHNAGFIALDYIANQLNVNFNKSKFDALFSEAVIDGKRVLLIKPQTFMNLSGESVVQFMSFYKIPSENVIILFDDISLAPGNLRVKRSGSHGGHNGMRNIIQLAKTDNFPRIKIGIGAKQTDWDLADWVTSKFSDGDLNLLNKAAENSYAALKLMLNGEIEKAMNLANRKIFN